MPFSASYSLKNSRSIRPTVLKLTSLVGGPSEHLIRLAKAFQYCTVVLLYNVNARARTERLPRHGHI